MTLLLWRGHNKFLDTMINKEIAILFQVVISEIHGIFHSTLAIFVSARVAGGDRPIAVMSAVVLQNAKRIVRLKNVVE